MSTKSEKVHTKSSIRKKTLKNMENTAASHKNPVSPQGASAETLQRIPAGDGSPGRPLPLPQSSKKRSHAQQTALQRDLLHPVFRIYRKAADGLAVQPVLHRSDLLARPHRGRQSDRQVLANLHLDGYAEARRAGKIIVIDSRQICRSLDADVRSLPRESAPAALENWARRRGTLAPDANEQHLGLDDTDLMLRTVQAEFNLKNLFAK